MKIKQKAVREAEPIFTFKELNTEFNRDERRSAAKTLRGVLTLFGPRGENWVKNNYKATSVIDGDLVTKACLVGAIEKVDGPGEWIAQQALLAQITKSYKGEFDTLEEFNDDQETKFSNIKNLVVRAIKNLNAQ